MATRFATAPQGSKVGILEMQMCASDVRQILVLDDHGHVVGMFTRADLRRAQEQGARGSGDAFMTRRLWTVDAGEEAVKAVDLMLAHGVAVIPVVDDDDRPVGLVSSVELFKLVRGQLAVPSRPSA